MASRTGMKKRVMVLSGSRAEYGLLKPVMKEIYNHQSLKMDIIIGGMHLSGEFGSSEKEIVKDGFKIRGRVEMNPESDSGFSMAVAIGKGMTGVAKILKEIKPDIFLVLGDRHEALAGTIAAGYMNIPVAHIHGGDSTRAGLDESARHAITKFAHIHFPATKKSAKRILKLGEDPWRVFPVGSPALDAIISSKLLPEKEIKDKFKLSLEKPYIIVVQHSVTTEPEKAGSQMVETLEAVKKIGYETVIVYPNSDAGGREIIKIIKRYESLPFIRVFKNLAQLHYLSLLKYGTVLVGNSSSGIIEAPSFKLPVVNVGIRQENRERSCNVIDVSHERNEIAKAIRGVLFNNKFIARIKKSKNPYGDGNSSKRIVKILSDMIVDKKLLQKQITY
jgi:UDP-N-acetylglucosamine 2-epimerase (non-hydrolysing)/GDP/UDP-N,N'-diacetylbacillosamine 2-epimerase (hydrolysing)